MTKILWADDQIDVAESFSSLLLPLNPEIEFVSTGEVALERLTNNFFNILILDLKMPPNEWGGLWLLQKLKDNNVSVPVIILSGEGTQKETIKAMRLGADNYILKEKVETELLSFVSELIEKYMSNNPVQQLIKQQKTSAELYKHKIKNGENKNTEFKSSFRYCIHRKTADSEIAHSSLKTIVAFLNTDGGELFIGVRDDREILGLENDFKVSGKGKDKDAFLLKLDNMISDQIGATHMGGNITIEFPVIDGTEIAVVKVKEKAPQPVWLKHDGKEQFYKRRFASSVELVGEEMHRYIKEHWD